MSRLRYLICISVFMLWGCSPLISLFDQYAYTQVTSIKVDALNVMDNAVENYSLHEKEVQAVDVSIRKMIEYEKHRPENSITTQMWENLNNTEQHLYGGFINRWKQKGKLDAAFIADQEYLIGLAFDQIAELESGKIKPSAVH